jgi:hypothetical protein
MLISLFLDVKLSQKQEYVWNLTVEKFLRQIPMTSAPILQYENVPESELQHCYSLELSSQPEIKEVDALVQIWNKIYPRNFDIELSDVHSDNCDCDIEIDDIARNQLTSQTMRFLHNRWLDSQILAGWRFGLTFNDGEKTDPRLRDWDSLPEIMRPTLAIPDKILINMHEMHKF